MNNIVLNIHDYLQQISSAQDQSITRLISSLKKRKGFGRIQLLNDPAKPMTLSIQHESKIITSQQIIKMTRTLADNLNRIFGHLLIKMSDICSNRNTKNANKLFENCRGITHVLAEPHGWVNLEFNRYITQKARLVKCINQKALTP